jgi:hypothetical protein
MFVFVKVSVRFFTDCPEVCGKTERKGTFRRHSQPSFLLEKFPVVQNTADNQRDYGHVLKVACLSTDVRIWG